jgi:hypothetical protein
MPSALAAQFAAATAGLLLFVLLLVLSGLFEPSEIETVKELRSYLWQRATQALAAVR